MSAASSVVRCRRLVPVQSLKNARPTPELNSMQTPAERKLTPTLSPCRSYSLSSCVVVVRCAGCSDCMAWSPRAAIFLACGRHLVLMPHNEAPRLCSSLCSLLFVLITQLRALPQTHIMPLCVSLATARVSLAMADAHCAEPAPSPAPCRSSHTWDLNAWSWLCLGGVAGGVFCCDVFLL